MILIIDISYYYLEPTLKKATWQKQSIECVYICIHMWGREDGYENECA